MKPKKLLLPPFLPVALLLFLCALVFFSEATGEVRMIDGRPDNAPGRASVILAMLSPLVYIVFGVFNLIDATMDRLSVRASWIGTAVLVTVFGLVLSRGLYAPRVDSTPYFALAAGFGLSIVIFAPMAVVRRFFIRSHPIKKNTEQVATSNGGQRPSLNSGFPPRRG
ncbi:MAG: hypothetical protein NTV80_14965 [Verrucomicrobia bacterium]|nr:hypothetical protein [Verrucomicrobiota bacterium]